jgi:hypothetical protein
MFIAFTSENYPNVMLPAYNASRWSGFFFYAFEIIGIFFLLNILLAAVIKNYRER